MTESRSSSSLAVNEFEKTTLAPGEFEAIEAHSIGITEHADGLRAAGQHVKRGLLLYGSPGTGKTHTVSYLTGRMQDRTTIVLTGGAVGAVGQRAPSPRSLQPATIVIEDVDLIAMDRQLPAGEHNALLFVCSHDESSRPARAGARRPSGPYRPGN